MSGEHDLEARLADGWRIRCPNGHVDLQDQRGRSVYCKSCGRAYPYDDLVDARRASEVPLVSQSDGTDG